MPMNKITAVDYAEDCVHLKACRRLCVIVKNELHKTFVRGCTDECGAYETTDDMAERLGLYTRSDVQKAINGATNDARNGYTDNTVDDYLR